MSRPMEGTPQWTIEDPLCGDLLPELLEELADGGRNELQGLRRRRRSLPARLSPRAYVEQLLVEKSRRDELDVGGHHQRSAHATPDAHDDESPIVPQGSPCGSEITPFANTTEKEWNEWSEYLKAGTQDSGAVSMGTSGVADTSFTTTNSTLHLPLSQASASDERDAFL